MRYFLIIISFFVLAGAFAQKVSIKDLEQELTQASSTADKLRITQQLGEAYLKVDTDKSIKYSKKAYQYATDKKDAGRQATTAYNAALAYERKRNYSNAEVWYKTCLKHAKRAGYSDLIIKSVQKRSKLAEKKGNYRKAYQINQEAFNYFSQKGNSMSDLDRKYDEQKALFEKERRELQKERDKMQVELLNLREESERLSTDKNILEERQAELLKANQDKEQELLDKQTQISEKEEELSAKQAALLSAEEQKKRAERLAKQKAKEVSTLSRKALEAETVKKSMELEAERTKRLLEESKNFRNLSFAAAGIIFLIALLLYSRFRSKKKATQTLLEKNKTIEEEKQRSNELLLNILPETIAEELKAHGKAKAHKYDEVTVLFTDFKNFTKISELLSPEELVEELDTCFKAFDFIISQYDDIEKIKTIGDAYMCASGLTDKKGIPYNIIRAAIEFQEFLDERKQERMRLGKPYFEARIGLHTGPVVAGVVGVNKFAYDIWGDTVNIAARMESKSEPGKINISESTYRLIKYKYDCEYRGKVDAKNKGYIDMYFVKGALAS